MVFQRIFFILSLGANAPYDFYSRIVDLLFSFVNKLELSYEHPPPPPFSWCLDNATNIIRSVNFRTSNPMVFQCNDIIDTKLKNLHGDKVQIAPRASHLYNFTSILTIRKPPHVGAFKEEQKRL